MTIRKNRAIERAEQNNPINVTILEGRIRKVISWEEYQEYLKLHEAPKENGVE